MRFVLNWCFMRIERLRAKERISGKQKKNSSLLFVVWCQTRDGNNVACNRRGSGSMAAAIERNKMHKIKFCNCFSSARADCSFRNFMLGEFPFRVPADGGLLGGRKRRARFPRHIPASGLGTARSLRGD